MRDYSFGNFLYELRMRSGLSQYQLGKLVGVSDKAVSKWENGLSKPKSNILCNLCDILGISVDELLSCKYHTLENKDEKGVFAMVKQLWNKVKKALYTRYGNDIPIEIKNRFYTEQRDMENTDFIVYFDFISSMLNQAEKQGEHIIASSSSGILGASFIANLLGANEINPLLPHYYCPKCKKVIFDNAVSDGWDLPAQKCSCGKEMVSDGHNIHFEAYRHLLKRTLDLKISVPPSYISCAKSMLLEYFGNFIIYTEEYEKNELHSYRISSKNSECSIILCTNDDLTRYKMLEKETSTSFKRISFISEDLLKAFLDKHKNKLLEMDSFFDIVEYKHIKSCYDIIQAIGITFSESNNTKQTIFLSKQIAYRDDVFSYIQEKLVSKEIFHWGFAYTTMENARKGIYSIKGISENTLHDMKSIGCDDWFVDSIIKTKYLYPKEYGITLFKLVATLLWYRIYYPKQFDNIIKL